VGVCEILSDVGMWDERWITGLCTRDFWKSLGLTFWFPYVSLILPSHIIRGQLDLAYADKCMANCLQRTSLGVALKDSKCSLGHDLYFNHDMEKSLQCRNQIPDCAKNTVWPIQKLFRCGHFIANVDSMVVAEFCCI